MKTQIIGHKENPWPCIQRFWDCLRLYAEQVAGFLKFRRPFLPALLSMYATRNILAWLKMTVLMPEDTAAAVGPTIFHVVSRVYAISILQVISGFFPHVQQQWQSEAEEGWGT